MPARLAARISHAAATVAVLAAVVGVCTPAAASARVEPSVPVIGIRSIGEATATRDTMTIKEIVIEAGGPGPLEVTLAFDVRNFNYATQLPFHFLATPTDPACTAVGGPPAYTLTCKYSREMDEGQNVLSFTVSHPISRPLYHPTGGSPWVGLSVTIDGIVAGRGVELKKAKPEGDLELKAGGPLTGRVGDLVDVPWTLTNVGLDPIPAHDAYVTLTAPPGTEWVKPDSAKCDPATTSGRQYRCRLANWLEPGTANAWHQTWSLKILAAEQGTGEIAATLYNATGVEPDDDFEDPTPNNNTATLSIEAASTPGALPVTGDRALPMAGYALLALVGGALLFRLARRRRA